MVDLLQWLTKHYPELLAAIGLGGGSGFLSKKLTDKNQDSKIKYLEDDLRSANKKLSNMAKEIVQVQNDVKTNTLFDKQFREQTQREYSIIEKEMKDVKNSLDRILTHLLSHK